MLPHNGRRLHQKRGDRNLLRKAISITPAKKKKKKKKKILDGMEECEDESHDTVRDF